MWTELAVLQKAVHAADNKMKVLMVKRKASYEMKSVVLFFE